MVQTNMNARVYRYGLLSPTEHGALVRDQMRAAHVYRNFLIEIERARRAVMRAEMPDDVAALAAEVRRVDEVVGLALVAVKASRAETRTRAVPEELAARLKAAREAKREAVGRLREARAKQRIDLAPWLAAANRGESTGRVEVERYLRAVLAYSALDDRPVPVGPNSAERATARIARENAAYAIQESAAAYATDEHPVHKAARVDAIQMRAGELRRAARAACGVPQGTYALVEAADDAARKVPIWEDAEPNDPGFVRWQGEGRVGVQLQGGLPALAVFGDDTRLRIAAVRDGAWHAKTRSERRRSARTVLRMRVGSEGREPVWASWPMVMHRPLPEGSRVMVAVVSLRKIGPREEWSVALTVDVGARKQARPSSNGAGAVAVDLGWRALPDGGMRVGYWRGTDGSEGEIRLSAADVRGLRLPEGLRSTRDRAMNAALGALVQWLRGNGMPEWMRAFTGRRGSLPTEPQALAWLSEWKSPGRLAKLVRCWRNKRYNGDDGAFAAAEAWRYHDEHLWSWETSQRTGALRHRREVYRIAAADLARRYNTLVLEDFDLRRVARRHAPDAESAENGTARSNRQAVATSELRAALVNAFASEGKTKLVVPAVDSTRTCTVCGIVRAFDAAADIMHTCECGTTWDQDANAALVLLRRGERCGEAEVSGSARDDECANDVVAVRESRWVRAKRVKREREAERGTARGTEGNPSE